MNEVITLEVNYNNLTEHIKTKVYRCDKCQGRGYIVAERGRGWHEIECKYCQGAGKIQGEITIKWRGYEHDRQSTER